MLRNPMFTELRKYKLDTEPENKVTFIYAAQYVCYVYQAIIQYIGSFFNCDFELYYLRIDLRLIRINALYLTFSLLDNFDGVQLFVCAISLKKCDLHLFPVHCCFM